MGRTIDIMISICSHFSTITCYYLYVIFAVLLFCCQMIGSTLFFMTCHVRGAGVEYDPKQQATAEFIDNMSIHYCIASMLNIQSRDKIL